MQRFLNANTLCIALKATLLQTPLPAMACRWPQESAKCSQVIDAAPDWPAIEPLIRKTVDSHHFSRCLQLLSTNSGLIPLVEEHIRRTETLSYYWVKNIPIYVLIHKVLIEAFVKRGQLCGLSVDKEVDRDDCMALLPNGVLVLSVKESTYHRTGLIGKKSILYRKKNCVKKYMIEIDLKSEKFTPGTKLYARTLECLQRSGLIFDVFVKWEVSEDTDAMSGDISSTSIENFFGYIRDNSDDNSLRTIECLRCLPSLRKFVNKDVPIPVIKDNVSEEALDALIEWFGAQMCQIDCNQSEETDVSTFGIADYEERDDISCIALNGFFTSFDVKRLLNALKEAMASSSDVFGVNGLNALIVNGFEDTPIAWKGARNEHSKNLSGENMYGIAWSGQQSHDKGLKVIWRTAEEYDFGIEKL